MHWGWGKTEQESLIFTLLVSIYIPTILSASLTQQANSILN